MMDYESWIAGIRSVLAELAEFPQTGPDGRNDDWGELVCRLWDDYDFDAFVGGHMSSAGLDDSQSKILLRLRDDLNSLCQRTRPNPTPAEVISAGWNPIKALAADAAASLTR